MNMDYYNMGYHNGYRDATEKAKAEIERLEELLSGAKQCIAEMEYAIDKVGISNSRIDDALEEWTTLQKEMVGEL